MILIHSKGDGVTQTATIKIPTRSEPLVARGVIEGGAIADFEFEAGPLAGKRWSRDAADVVDRLLTEDLKAASSAQAWRDHCAAICSGLGVAAPAAQLLGGDSVDTQKQGLQRVCDALGAAGKLDGADGRPNHILDLAAEWNESEANK